MPHCFCSPGRTNLLRASSAFPVVTRCSVNPKGSAGSKAKKKKKKGGQERRKETNTRLLLQDIKLKIPNLDKWRIVVII